MDHKDDLILSLEKKLKEASDENIKSENKIHKLVKDFEQVKIENNELKTLKKLQRTELQKTPGDDTYDNEDEAEFDSEKEILQAKDRGFRRSGPQAQPIEVFRCTKCQYSLKDKASLEKHIRNHEEHKFTCRKCELKFDRESDLEFHLTYEHKRLYEWNCMKCCFQTNDKASLKNHFDLKHTEGQGKIICEDCNLEFNSSWHLKNHIRDDHGQKELCSHFKENKCKFGERCWKKHSDSPNRPQNITFTCYSCKENFASLKNLMTHKKNKHREHCKPCSPKSGACRLENTPEKCWYIHQDFQMDRGNQGPP